MVMPVMKFREMNMFCKFNSISLILSFKVHILLKLASKSLIYITVITNVLKGKLRIFQNMAVQNRLPWKRQL